MSKDTPEGYEEHKPSGKKTGLSMKERLLAQRQAEAAEIAGASKPTPPVKKKSSPRPARPVKQAAPKAAAPAPEADGEESKSEARKPRSSARGARSGSSRRKGGSSRRGTSDDAGAEGEERSGRRRGAKKEEKNMMVPAIGAVVLLGLGGFGVYKFTSSGKAEAASTEDTNVDTAAADKKTADAAAKAEADRLAKDAEAKNAADAEAAAAAKAKADAEAKPADDGEPKVERNSKGRQKVKASVPDNLYDPNDPNEPQIATFELFGPADGCTEEQWAIIQEKATVMMDVDSGAAGTRAKLALKNDYGRLAMPALVNILIRLDYSTAEGHDTGDFVQRTMSEICNGRNIDWNYGFADEPNKATILNRRTVGGWYLTWNKVVEDPKYWDNFAGNTEAAKRAKAGGSDSSGSGDAPAASANDDDLDDLLDD